MKHLVRENMVKRNQKGNRRITVLTITNYKKFQSIGDGNNHYANLIITSTAPASNHTEEKEENIHTRARACANESSPDVRAIFEKLVAASGDALDQTRPNLHAIIEPLQWINAGADLDQDILPTIRAKSAGMGAGKIKSWRFFEGAVMDALATRNRVDKRGAEIRAGVKARKQPAQQEPDPNEYVVKSAGDPYAFH